MIQNRIVKDINNSGGFYSVLADETQDIATIEQLSLCCRYVNFVDGKVHEDFLCFHNLHSNFDLDFSSIDDDEVLEPK